MIAIFSIYVRCGGQHFQETVGIPMETNCAHYWLTCFSIPVSLFLEGKRNRARKFNLSYRYTDDIISFKNKRFKEFIYYVYP